MHGKSYWFRRRRFGIGWSPRSWEGWAATSAFVVLQAIAPKLTSSSSKVDPERATHVLRLGAAVAFSALVIATGE
ncbi:MAG TPA: hypothetical protein VMV73_02290, partial [Candidatus Dormibacteraeota bacterium]|nr:hypothetical protein [Candidatus Dormibacteraeota bacterium]